ncbi:uncharacterized protein MYCFIDRAFT_179290 [Pseudocercospora fijiensis CIRAD86]|uniref:Protein kinase domain-containing protein n=1 Tax=Pseudocercospora fijiensis (strain CIRAD86) TaxID=383855 RepID=M3A080_PSEFD|nr:uncharacterized protein MYCFIDRAFT_179290 [Pseudocercospora fijiensis CIRAD86]EME77806.1 hypothetical protein MYCFIDRAFT_179290 [Pseudocercospora fijiensis CIRAD86]
MLWLRARLKSKTRRLTKSAAIPEYIILLQLGDVDYFGQSHLCSRNSTARLVKCRTRMSTLLPAEFHRDFLRGHVELSDSGFAIKTAWRNEARNGRADLVLEAKIYQILGKHDHPEECAITLEFAPNGSLNDYLRDHPDISSQRRMQWATECAEGLAVLHAAEIIHFDFKPGNLLLDAALHIKVIDFGSASLQGSRPNGYSPSRYSPWGNAPEDTWPLGVQVDIFALGSTIFKIWAAEDPFEEQSSEEYPDVTTLSCGDIIRKRGKPGTANELVTIYINRDHQASFIDLIRPGLQECLTARLTSRTARIHASTTSLISVIPVDWTLAWFCRLARPAGWKWRRAFGLILPLPSSLIFCDRSECPVASGGELHDYTHLALSAEDNYPKNFRYFLLLPAAMMSLKRVGRDGRADAFDIAGDGQKPELHGGSKHDKCSRLSPLCDWMSFPGSPSPWTTKRFYLPLRRLCWLKTMPDCIINFSQPILN